MDIIGKKAIWEYCGKTYEGTVTKFHPKETDEWWDGEMLTVAFPTFELWTEPENVIIF